MSKPVTPQEMFDMWQKMVNPGGYPLQSLMFPILDAKEIDKKIAELETVEHWLKANINMLQLTIKSLQYQRAMLKGGEKFQQEMAAGAESNEAPNPAMWAWKLMADAGKTAMEQMGKTAAEQAKGPAESGTSQPPKRKKKPAA